jgi:hypothetical protein
VLILADHDHDGHARPIVLGTPPNQNLNDLKHCIGGPEYGRSEQPLLPPRKAHEKGPKVGVGASDEAVDGEDCVGEHA